MTVQIHCCTYNHNTFVEFQEYYCVIDYRAVHFARSWAYTYVQRGAVRRTAHEDPVCVAGLRSDRQEVGTSVVRA